MKFLKEMQEKLAKKADECAKDLGAIMKEDPAVLKNRFKEVLDTSNVKHVRLNSESVGSIGKMEQAAIALLNDYASLNFLKGHFGTNHAAIAATVEIPNSTVKEFPHFWYKLQRNRYTLSDTTHSFCIQAFIYHIKCEIAASQHPDINPDGRLQAIFNLLEEYGLYSPDNNKLLVIDC